MAEPDVIREHSKGGTGSGVPFAGGSGDGPQQQGYNTNGGVSQGGNGGSGSGSNNGNVNAVQNGKNVGGEIGRILGGDSSSGGGNSGGASNTSPSGQVDSGKSVGDGIGGLLGGMPGGAGSNTGVSSGVDSIGEHDIITINGQPVGYIPIPGGAIVGGQTVSLGQTVTFNDVAISLPTIDPSLGQAGNGQSGSGSNSPGGNPEDGHPQVLVIGGSSTTLTPPGPVTHQGPAITVGPSILSSTLSRSNVTTIAGTTLSIGTSGTIIIGGNTTVLSNPMPGSITIGPSTVLSLSNGDIVIGSSTLKPGAVIAIDGTVISIGTSGTIIVAGRTSVLGTTSGATQTTGVGDYVLSGIGGRLSSSPGVVGTGSGEHQSRRRSRRVLLQSLECRRLEPF
ncbi:hypothetical protein P152DRAFT_452965 [Eremomyces bilateralis CBS 781.70]|uniref:Uncharacterized protein n=1 Tax=Eremomyces bilateralis CBS 781.70 TaxID=1392243 RepID=A0A6G1FR12_9PEZI|nr:uncharacterized protein P152DRAFT_452965 [Eremomyces bilateralis CBS 781.70]KAF1808275.1 hypothetical protein P152DRAFT_452965 [Eremomyces bilateralis CBS 781.70]